MRALHDHNVLILGLGLSGLSMARWCTRHGARVTVADTRAAPPQLASLQAECPSARFVAGALDADLLAQDAWTLVARSPGLFPAQLAAVQAWTQAHGVALVGELDLFAQALLDLSQRPAQPYTPQVLAITGTNGKTTVTSLTTALLQRAGLNVAMAGNIGPALLDVLSQALDTEARAEAAEAAAKAATAPPEANNGTSTEAQTPAPAAQNGPASAEPFEPSEPSEPSEPTPTEAAETDTGPASKPKSMRPSASSSNSGPWISTERGLSEIPKSSSDTSSRPVISRKAASNRGRRFSSAFESRQITALA